MEFALLINPALMEKLNIDLNCGFHRSFQKKKRMKLNNHMVKNMGVLVLFIKAYNFY